MTETYPRMNKINDLAAELINELESRKNSIYSEISYAAYDEVGVEINWLIMRGWDEDSAKYKASENIQKYHEEYGDETPYDEELRTIEESIKQLKKLTLEGVQS